MKQDMNKGWTDAVREKILSDGAAPSPVSWEAVRGRVRRAAALRHGALAAAVAVPLAALLLWSPFGRPSGLDPAVAELVEAPSSADPSSVNPDATSPSFAGSSSSSFAGLTGESPAPAQDAGQAGPVGLLPPSDRSRLADGLSAERQPTPRTLPTPPDKSIRGLSRPLLPLAPLKSLSDFVFAKVPGPRRSADADFASLKHQRAQADAQPPHQLPLESESSTKTGQNVDEKAPSATLLAFSDPAPQRRPKLSVALGGNMLPAGHLSSQLQKEYSLYTLMVIQENTYYMDGMSFGKSNSSYAYLWNLSHQHRMEILEQTIPKQLMLTDMISWHHDLPLGIALTARLDLTSRLAVETGLEYTYLHSTEELSEEARLFLVEGVLPEDGGRLEYLDQKLHFIGIPVRLIWRAWSPGRWDVYAGVGIKGDKCIKAQLGVEKLEERRLQWSAEAFGGVQYRLWDRTHLYFQPALTWYFTQTDLVTYRTENPLGLSLHAGLRFDL